MCLYDKINCLIARCLLMPSGIFPEQCKTKNVLAVKIMFLFLLIKLAKTVVIYLKRG